MLFWREAQAADIRRRLDRIVDHSATAAGGKHVKKLHGELTAALRSQGD